MPGIGEIFSFSGILKVLEILLGFITIIIHRYGDYGKMIFFGSVEDQLQQVGGLTKKIIYVFRNWRLLFYHLFNYLFEFCFRMEIITDWESIRKIWAMEQLLDLPSFHLFF